MAFDWFKRKTQNITTSTEEKKVEFVSQSFTLITTDEKFISFRSTNEGLDFDEFKGKKAVLVDVFATWCPPCQKELAAVESKLWPEFKDNANFKLLVIGRDHTNEELKTYNTKKNFTFPLYADKGRVVFDSFASSTIPRSYLIDKDGKVIHISIGFNETEFSELMQKIEEAIK